MKKEVKAQVLEAIAAQIQQYPNFYITDIAGLNAEQTSSLRRECFEQGIKLTVVKNTLFKKALKDLNNSEVELLFPTLEGNTAIMYTEAPQSLQNLSRNTTRPDRKNPLSKELMSRSAPS